MSQRSTSNLEKIKIYPAHEYILEDNIENVTSRILENIYEGKRLEALEKDVEEIKSGNYISKIDKYFNEFYRKQESILQYLSDKYVVVIDELSKINSRAENIISDLENLTKSLIEKEKIVPGAIQNMLTFGDIQNILDNKKLLYIDKLNNVLKSNIQKFTLNYRQLNYYKNGIDLFVQDIKNFLRDNKNVYVLVDLKEKLKKVESILQENDIECRIEETSDKTIISKNIRNTVVITAGKLSEGFECYDLNQIVIVADELVSAERRTRHHKREEFKQGE